MTSQDKAIAYIVRTSGITSPTMLAELLDIPVETARSWMRRVRRNGFNLTGEIRPEGSIPPVQSHQGGSITPVGSDPLARAYKESPTEIVISKLASRVRACEREIEGLNGATPIFVDRLAALMCDPMTGQVPDPDLAHRLIETNVAAYTPEKVKVGIAELEAYVAEKGRPRNWAKAFSSFVKQANPQPRPTKAEGERAWLLRDVPRPDVATLEIEGNYV